MTNKPAKDKPASQMLTVAQMEQVIAEQGKRIFELENATQPSLPSAIQALAPAAAQGVSEQIESLYHQAEGGAGSHDERHMQTTLSVIAQGLLNILSDLASQPASVPAASVAAGAAPLRDADLDYLLEYIPQVNVRKEAKRKLAALLALAAAPQQEKDLPK